MKMFLFGVVWLLVLGMHLNVPRSENSISSQPKDPVGIGESLKSFSSQSALNGSSWGFSLTDCQSGLPIEAWNSDQKLIPGSTQKLFVTAAILDKLSPTHTFTTTCFIETEGLAGSGKVGNILIRAGGDPTWGSSRFGNTKDAWELAQAWVYQLKLMGISEVSGSVLVVDDYYDDPFPPGSWSWEDLGNYYAPVVSSITWRDGRYDLVFKTGSPSSATELQSSDPDWLKDFHINLVRSGTTGSGDEAYIYGMPLVNKRFVRGTLPPYEDHFTISGSLPDPGYALARDFTDFLEKEGIEVKGEPTSLYGHEIDGKFPMEGYQELLSFHSPQLLDLLRHMNFRSENLYAEMLLKELGRLHQVEANTNGGIGALMEYSKGLGLNTEPIQWKDGSGLSRQNLVTPAFQAQFLTKASQTKNFNSIIESLPEGGKEGTLRYLNVGGGTGTIWAKSGTMTGVRAYAGYYKSGNGKWYAFSFLVNNFQGTSVKMRQLMEPVFQAFSELP